MVIFLLLIGLIIGRQTWTTDAPPEAMEAREWFWGERRLDLAVQAALIFVGALGTAALLPSPRHRHEEPPETGPPGAQPPLGEEWGS
jgi:hypothetical protein